MTFLLETGLHEACSVLHASMRLVQEDAPASKQATRSTVAINYVLWMLSREKCTSNFWEEESPFFRVVTRKY
jgi:hypothetical protein